MKILRFTLPFLFVRNWHDGSWELSRARFVLFLLAFTIVVVGIGVALVLQSPVMYSSQTL